jgi:hypothetical protein
VSALLFVIKVPPAPNGAQRKDESFFASCMFGVKYLLRNRSMLNMVLLFMWLNLFAHIGAMGIAPALVLARSGNSEAALGMYNTAVGIGSLIGGIMMTLWRPAKSRTKSILWSCLAMCFLVDFPLAFGRTIGIWAAGALLGNIALPILNATSPRVCESRSRRVAGARVFRQDTLQLGRCRWTVSSAARLPTMFLSPGWRGNRPFSSGCPVL